MVCVRRRRAAVGVLAGAGRGAGRGAGAGRGVPAGAAAGRAPRAALAALAPAPALLRHGPGRLSTARRHTHWTMDLQRSSN